MRTSFRSCTQSSAVRPEMSRSHRSSPSADRPRLPPARATTADSASSRGDATAHHAPLRVVVGEGAVAGATSRPRSRSRRRRHRHRTWTCGSSSIECRRSSRRPSRSGGTDDAAGVQRREEQALATGDRVRRDERVLDAGVVAPEPLGDLRAVVAFDRREQRRIRGVKHASTARTARARRAAARRTSPPSTPRSCRRRTPGSTTALRKPSAGGCAGPAHVGVPREAGRRPRSRCPRWSTRSVTVVTLPRDLHR